jgi:hypothetical protein
MVDGRIGALDTPASLKRQFGADSMDEVFYRIAGGASRTFAHGDTACPRETRRNVRKTVKRFFFFPETSEDKI